MGDTNPVSVTTDGDLAIITVNNPPINALSQAVRQGLVEALKSDAASSAKAVVLACEGRTFFAGADITEFDKPNLLPLLPDAIAEYLDFDKPVIAALHGTVLGGGLEVALGCSHRIALSSTKIGLPEVNLGLIPGAGGTQFVPRVASADFAIELITGGKPVSAEKAAEHGLIDRVVDDNLLEEAKAFARMQIGKPLKKMSADPAKDPFTADEWESRRASIVKKAKGQQSPVEAFDTLKMAYEMSLAEGWPKERDIFIRLKGTDQSKALRHAFFAERAVAKPKSLPKVDPRPVETIGIIGGGTMGAGIAVCFLDAGFPVTMVERNDEALENGRRNVEKVYDGNIKKGRMDEAAKAGTMERLTGSTDMAALAGTDLIIEAVFEEMGVKKSVFADLDKHAKPGAILATNTSYLNINEIAAATSRPQDVVGLHFFSPANIMRLLEIVRTDEVADDVLVTAFAIAKKIRKVGVLVGVCDGFVGNRILKAYRQQVDYLIEDGAWPADVDRAIKGFGFAMGPFAMADLAGLDIGWANRKREAPTRDPNMRYVEIADRLCELGRFGQKTGAGWYRYEKGDRTPNHDPLVHEIIEEVSAGKGIERRSFNDEEIVDRVLMAMINEGAKILEEGVAERPLDIEMVELFGYGFPRWRGGPMCYADSIGLNEVVRRMEHYASLESGKFTPVWEMSPLLRRLADEGKSFADLNTA